jgi:carbonic anhydrase/acetyltransferase-like protein (isoleucine patch superfamily)
MSERAHEFRLDPGLTRIDPSAFVAPGAVVLGDVELGPEVTVWYGAVVRGDTERIRIGARSNIQDGTVVHADPGFPCLIGTGVTVGHRAVVHGARVGDGSLVGMSATIMNGAVVGERCLVGAGALVASGKELPPGSLVLGAPARVVRPLTEKELADLVEGAAHYVAAGAAYRRAGLDLVGARGRR